MIGGLQDFNFSQKILFKKRDRLITMNPIPKQPEVPDLTERELNLVETAVFGFENTALQPRAALVFGGTHPGAWLHTIELYKQYCFEKLFVTGGHKRTGVAHHTWSYDDRPEAEVISEKLLEAGIPEEKLILETRSENTKDNLLFIGEQVRIHNVQSLALICRSYAAGRQSRTFRKHLPELTFAMLPYDTDVTAVDGPFGRHNWKEKQVWRSRVWGEYLRIVEYGKRGDLVFDIPAESLVDLSRFPKS